MFVLNHHDQHPLYVQLYKQIRAHVLSGKLPAGIRLPSVRVLADELSTSRNTVETAYQELYAEGYIYSKPRSGYFVSALDPEAVPSSLAPEPGKPASPAEPPPPCAYDFHPARLDPASFPARLWRKLFNEALRACAGSLAEYADPQGDWGLRCSLGRYLERSRGVLCVPEQIVICSGLQHSLEIVAQLLPERPAVVAVEDPGFFLPRSVFRNHGCNVVPVPVGVGGLDLEVLKASDSTVAYVTPSHQFPLGSVMPVANRLKLIEWAESGDKLIIEDDYDSELRYHGKPIPSLQGLRPGGKIVYVGTFSKILSPALRVSYLVLPHALLAAYRRRFHDYCSTVSLLEQRTLARFMEEGHWDRHVRRMRTVYRKKQETLLRAVERHFGGQAVVIGQGAGLHVVLQLAGDRPGEAELIARARQQGIRILPFSVTCAKAAPEAVKILLGFGGLTTDAIEQGIALLAQCCSDLGFPAARRSLIS